MSGRRLVAIWALLLALNFAFWALVIAGVREVLHG